MLIAHPWNVYSNFHRAPAQPITNHNNSFSYFRIQANPLYRKTTGNCETWNEYRYLLLSKRIIFIHNNNENGRRKNEIESLSVDGLCAKHHIAECKVLDLNRSNSRILRFTECTKRNSSRRWVCSLNGKCYCYCNRVWRHLAWFSMFPRWFGPVGRTDKK